MSILKNFVNPWESGGLGSQVLDTNVLSDNVLVDDIIEELGSELNPYRGYCFDEKGELIARFKYVKPSGGVFVMLRRVKNAFPKKENESKTDRKLRYFKYLKKHRVKMSNFYEDDMSKQTIFPASSISKIYTRILKDFSYDLTKLQNGKLSVYGSYTYRYNDANPAKGILGTTYKGIKAPAQFRITIGTGALNLLDTVGCTISALGTHEYEGHGIERWRDVMNTHYRVYEYQEKHKTWQFLTTDEKDDFISRYVYYIRTELISEPSALWDRINYIERKYGDKNLYPETNLKLRKLYKDVGK